MEILHLENNGAGSIISSKFFYEWVIESFIQIDKKNVLWIAWRTAMAFFWFRLELL